MGLPDRTGRPRGPVLDRRRFLLLGGAAAVTAAAVPGCVAPVQMSPNDLAGAARANYRESVLRLHRPVRGLDGVEVSEPGRGLLASADGLRGVRGSRPGAPDFDVLIVGSGYGGAVCAARLGEARRRGVRIGLVERGREWVPGTFPATLTNFNPLNPFDRRVSWMNEQLSRNPLGLYGFYDRGDVVAVAGSGLGGTSLINCAVAIEAEEAVFQQPEWPLPFRKKALHGYYQRARRMLDTHTTPEDRYPAKLRSHLGVPAILRARGRWEGVTAFPVELAVNFSPHVNRQGMRQQGCVQCGDCTTGCNVGAKNSLDVSYLPLAWTHGAEMYTQIEVEHVERVGGVYRVHFLQRPDGAHEERGWVDTRVLILSAGTLGSTEILLRSRQKHGLPLSGWLGHGFSGNGNYLGFVDYQYTDPPVLTNTGGVGIVLGPPKVPVGTSIQGAIDFRLEGEPLVRHVVLEDLAHPSAHVGGLSLLLLADLNRGMTLLGCGHDTASGEIRLEGDNVAVRWPDYERQASHAQIIQHMREYATAHGGRFRPFAPARNYTAHPLGGCRMGLTAQDGVVDDRGRVFDGTPRVPAGQVHPGLYVVDGAVVPTALGNNPLLTITALAERAAELIVRDPDLAALFSSLESPAVPDAQQSP